MLPLFKGINGTCYILCETPEKKKRERKKKKGNNNASDKMIQP